jgi:hypothetical protein
LLCLCPWLSFFCFFAAAPNRIPNFCEKLSDSTRRET